MINVRIKLLNDKAKVPNYATPKAAGCELYSTEFHILKPGERKRLKQALARKRARKKARIGMSHMR